MLGAGEMSQQLKALAAFSQELIWFPTLTQQFTTTCNSYNWGHRESNNHFRPPRAPGFNAFLL